MVFVQRSQRCLVHTVIMVVADQNQMNWRQILEIYTRQSISLWTNPLEWTGSFRPDGICEDIVAAHLNQKRGVSNPCDTDFVFRCFMKIGAGWNSLDRIVSRSFERQEKFQSLLPISFLPFNVR